MKLVLLLLLVISPSVFANELCDKAGIVSLQLIPIDLPVGREACRTPLTQLSAMELRLLSEIVILHQKVADLFNIDIRDLFTAPLTVEFKEYILGPMVSTAGTKVISMATFPGDGFALNTGVYLHELGHVLAVSQNNNLPETLKDLNQSVLFSESIADLLALTIHGNIMTPMSETSTCLDRIRFITNFQTYNYPMEYFQNFSEARIMMCCESLVKTTTDKRILNLCELAQNYFSVDIDLRQKFDPQTNERLDDHQLGIPLLSFISNFAKKSDKTLREVFNGVFLSNKSPSKESFTCTYVFEDEVVFSESKEIYTVKSIFDDYYKQLSAEDQHTFSKLFDQHAIPKGLTYSENDFLKRMRKEFIKKLNLSSSENVLCQRN